MLPAVPLLFHLKAFYLVTYRWYRNLTTHLEDRNRRTLSNFCKTILKYIRMVEGCALSASAYKMYTNDIPRVPYIAETLDGLQHEESKGDMIW